MNRCDAPVGLKNYDGSLVWIACPNKDGACPLHRHYQHYKIVIASS